MHCLHQGFQKPAFGHMRGVSAPRAEKVASLIRGSSMRLTTILACLENTGLHFQVRCQGQRGGKYLQAYLDLFSIPLMKTCFDSLHVWAHQVDSRMLLHLRDPSR